MRSYVPHVLCLSILASPGFAQGTETRDSVALTLEAALATALAENPTLRAENLQLDAAEARVDAAGLRPPLEVSADFENFAGSGTLSGVDSLETTLRLWAVFEPGQRRDRRRDVAERERDVVAADADRRRLEILAEVATHFVDATEAQEALVTRQDETRLAEAAVAAVGRRIEIGAAPRFELGRARIALTQAKIRAEHAEHELAADKRRLAALLGAREPRFNAVRGDLYALPQVEPYERLVAALDRNPDLLALQAEQRLAEARIRLARAMRRPEISTSVGVRYFEALGDTAFVAGVSVPLGASPRAQFAEREAIALRGRSDDLQRANRLQLEALLFELSLELQHARLEFDALRGPVLAEARAVVDQVERGFREGRFGFQDYALAQKELSDTRLGAIAAAGRFHRLLVEIELLTGSSAASMGEQE
jgi:cobalt-zinc-cadmium efflux system outer membrane protein